MMTQAPISDNLNAVEKTYQTLLQIAGSAALEGKAIHETESEIWAGLIQLGHQLVGTVLTQLGNGDIGQEIREEGKPTLKRSKKPKHRRYRSVFGVYDLWRFTYAEQDKRAEQRCPLDEQVGLPQHDYSLLLETWIGNAASEDSFGQAVAMLERMVFRRIPVDSAERVCKRQAEFVSEFFDELSAPAPKDEGQLLVATIDRKGVPIRRPHAAPQPVFAPSEDKGMKPGTKKMATVGSVYSVDRHYRDAQAVLDALFRCRHEPQEPAPQGERARAKRPRPKSKRIRAMLPGEVDDGGKKVTLDTVAVICDWLNEQVELRKAACQELLLLCDGEDSLWEMASASRPESTTWTEILDLLHAVPRIWTCGELLHDGEPLARYVHQRIEDLLRGRGKSVIRGFRRKATLLGLTGKARHKVDTACNYLERQLPRMKYDEYLARGLPIATGVIEGACRHLVKDRLERSGMRWTIDGAQSILDLRSVLASSHWDSYQLRYRKQRLQERYGETRTNFMTGPTLAA